MRVKMFQRIVWAHYKKHGRDTLPWRATRNPYRVLVSEVMLQQTQVKRVIPFYLAFIKRFPTFEKLAASPLSEALKAWQGLGYNRRAKMLHQAAQKIVENGMPRTVHGLEALPGIGPYTARAVTVFAFNQDRVLIETNIRTVIICHFFPKKKKVADTEIERVLARALPVGRAREWNFALMDYGAYLKQSGVRLNARSKHHVTQKKFAGSMRETRGAILRELVKGSRTLIELGQLFAGKRKVQVRRALEALSAEGFVTKAGSVIMLP